MFIKPICISPHRNKQSSSISVSVDGAWQKRGSGRSYDNLTGNIIQLWSLYDYHTIMNSLRLSYGLIFTIKTLLGQMYYLYHTGIHNYWIKSFGWENVS